MSYCIYLRKSRKDIEAEQNNEGETLARHERTLRTLAQKQNRQISCIYREIVSGETISARPVMQQLLREVEQNVWKGVFVMEIERLARGDTIDQGIVQRAFQYSDTLIITPLKIYEPNDEQDQEYFEFGLFMSRREYQTTKRRMMAGRYAAVKEGKWPFNTTPYGYDREKLKSEKGWILTPHKTEAPILKLIFHLFTNSDRMGITQIRHYLNDRSIPPRKGYEWIESSLRGILSNVVYDKKVCIGQRKTITKIIDGSPTKTRQRTADYIIEEGRHPRLIDHQTFDKAQYYLQLNSFQLPKTCQIKNPLAGLVICSECQAKMQRRPANRNPQKKNPQTYDMIICPTRNCPTVACSIDVLESEIIWFLSDWTGHYQLKSSCSPTHLDLNQKLLIKAQQKHNGLLSQLEQLHTLLEQRIYSPDIYAERLIILKDQISQSAKAVDKLTQDLHEEFARVESLAHLPPMYKPPFDFYPQLAPPQQNKLLKTLLESIVYKKLQRNAYGEKDSPAFELVITPRLPR